MTLRQRLQLRSESAQLGTEGGRLSNKDMDPIPVGSPERTWGWPSLLGFWVAEAFSISMYQGKSQSGSTSSSVLLLVADLCPQYHPRPSPKASTQASPSWPSSSATSSCACRPCWTATWAASWASTSPCSRAPPSACGARASPSSSAAWSRASGSARSPSRAASASPS